MLHRQAILAVEGASAGLRQDDLSQNGSRHSGPSHSDPSRNDPRLNDPSRNILLQNILRHSQLRRMAPRATLAAIRPLALACGVTRLADVTGLDTVGIPVFHAVRPLARSVSVSQGKGITRDAARVSALIETIELHHAEHVAPTSSGMARAGDFLLEEDAHAHAWCDGNDLLSGRTIRVAHSRVSMDYAGSGDVPPIATSSGLASGNDRVEAILAGLYECIERDAHSRWLGLPPGLRQQCAIDPDTITRPLGRRLLRMVRAAGLGFRLWSFGDDHELAAIACALYETGAPAATVLPPTIGAGAHLDPGVALVRAVTEAAQARVTLIAGARDDLTCAAYDDPAHLRLRLLTLDVGCDPPRLPWERLRSRSTGSSAHDLDLILARAAAAGARQIACVDLSEPDLPIAVVKILVSGFDPPACAHAHRA